MLPKDRLIIAIALFFALSYFYGLAQGVMEEWRTVNSWTQILPTALESVLITAAFLGGGVIIVGLASAISGAYLHLENGSLEYRWKWWKWEHHRTTDLSAMTEVRHYTRTFYRGRKTATLGMLFTGKPKLGQVQVNNSSMVEEYFIPFPQGVTKEESETFVQKVQAEIQRVNGRR